MKKNLQNKSVFDEALELTSAIFKNIDVSKYNYNGYELIWSIYNVVHIYGSIPYFLKIKKNSKHISNNNFLKSFILKIKIFAQDILLVLYSLFSIIYVRFFTKDLVVIWTGDFYSFVAKGDFRVGDLYIELDKNRVDYIDFIRDDSNGFFNTIKNMMKRKRPVIYYNSIERVVLLLSSYDYQVYLLNENALHRKILEKSISAIAQPKKIELWRKIFRFLDTKKFVSWEFSERQANLIYAAKLNNIETIGFMHGAGMKNYMAHEYMSEFNGEKKIGPDVMGVWSEWWKDYFESNTQLYGNVDVSGELRKVSSRKISDSQKEIKKVLWISEPLIEPKEVIEYMRYFKSNYELIIKKRPSTNDIFYNKLISEYQDFSNLAVLDGDIFESIKKCDLVVGSHSTAVIEASKMNKPFLLVNTKKWGNYFEVDNKLFLENIDEIDMKISNILNINLSKIKEQYFGKDEDDGVKWLIRKIKNDK